jgi:hypothetical protein
MEFISGVLVSVVTYFIVQFIITKIKNKKHARKTSFFSQTPNRKNPPFKKLFRFTRGNKTLTAEQQHELFIVNSENIKKLRQLWKNEHL